MNSKRFNQKIRAFTVCFIISFIIWFTIKQTDKNTIFVTKIIKLINIPAGKILVGRNDSVITVELLNKNLLFYNLNPFHTKTIVIDLKNLKLITKGNISAGILNQHDIIELISYQLSPHHKIVAVHPSQIHFNFCNLYHRKIPVKSRLQIKSPNPFKLLNPVKFDYDSVMVCGMKEIIDTITYIYTENKILTDVSQNKTCKLSLINPVNSSLITLSPTEISTTIDVERFTEKTIKIPITTSECQRKNNLKIFPDEVAITMQIPMSRYNSINDKMFRIGINCSDISNKSFLSVQLIEKPEFVTVSKIKPEKVEYILIKK